MNNLKNNISKLPDEIIQNIKMFVGGDSFTDELKIIFNKINYYCMVEKVFNPLQYLREEGHFLNEEEEKDFWKFGQLLFDKKIELKKYFYNEPTFNNFLINLHRRIYFYDEIFEEKEDFFLFGKIPFGLNVNYFERHQPITNTQKDQLIEQLKNLMVDNMIEVKGNNLKECFQHLIKNL